MKLSFAIILASLVSFVSISMEILWISIIGYLVRNHAGIFAFVLSLVLFGIAFGAKYGYNKSKSDPKKILFVISSVLLLAGIINFLGFPLIGRLMTIHEAFGVLLVFIVIIVSFLLGSIFPLLCHISISTNEKSVGQHTSWIYAGSIIGSTAGPLITGYILIDHFEIQTIITMLCIVCIILSLVIQLNFKTKLSKIKFIAIRLSVVALMFFIAPSLYANYFELFHFRTNYNKEIKFKYFVQNRAGIITVVENKESDIVYGGGAYDGRIDIDIEKNTNGIDRTYMIAAFHPNPENVLMVGLSTGSWARILADYSLIKKLTIVEINPKYLEIIEKYPEIAEILTDSKIEIIIDDGRRWLKRNPDKKFDLIIMNTTWHWREHITNLLSVEYLNICKNSLNESGVMYWNTTGMRDIVFTAANVFEHVFTFENFVGASDAPFNMSYVEKKNNFLKFERDSKPIFEKNIKTLDILEELAKYPLTDIHDSVLKENLWLITDNNMATEYKSGVWHKIYKFFLRYL